MNIDDDTLIAYLDAQLEDDAAYETVEDALAASPALRARLQELAETGELARQAFDAKLEEAVPPQLIAAIMSAPLPGAEEGARTATPAADAGLTRAPARPADAAAAQPASGRPALTPSSAGSRPGATRPSTPGLGARLAAWLGGGFGAAAAFASVVTLALGALIGHYLLPPTELAAPLARVGDPIRDPALAMALQAAPSGVVLDAGGQSLEIRASFPAREGGFCREYTLGSTSGAGGGQQIGIACRTPADDANWQLAFSAGGEGDPNGYGTASDRLHEAADAFLGENVDGAPLDAERERALITRGWNAD